MFGDRRVAGRVAAVVVPAAIVLMLHAPPALAQSTYWGEGRSRNFSADQYEIISNATLIPVTLRTDGPQVDVGALFRVDDPYIVAVSGLVVRNGYGDGEARTFIYACSDASGCKGEWGRKGNRPTVIDVNKGVSQSQYNTMVGVQLHHLSGNFFGQPPSSDLGQIERVLLSNPDEESEAHAAYYGRNQGSDTSGAFTVQYPGWSYTTYAGASAPVSVNKYSVTTVKQPNSDAVRHYNIVGGASVVKGICAVWTVAEGCPDP